MSSYGYPPGQDGLSPTYARDRFWSTPPAPGGPGAGDPWGQGQGNSYTPQMDFHNSNYVPYGQPQQPNGGGGSQGQNDLTFPGPSPPNPNQLQPISYPPQSPCGVGGSGRGQYTPSSTPTPQKVNGINGSQHSSSSSTSGSPPNHGTGSRPFPTYVEDQQQNPSGLPNGHTGSSNLLTLGPSKEMINGHLNQGGNGTGDPYRGGSNGNGTPRGYPSEPSMKTDTGGDPYHSHHQQQYQTTQGYYPNYPPTPTSSSGGYPSYYPQDSSSYKPPPPPPSYDPYQGQPMYQNPTATPPYHHQQGDYNYHHHQMQQQPNPPRTASTSSPPQQDRKDLGVNNTNSPPKMDNQSFNESTPEPPPTYNVPPPSISSSPKDEILLDKVRESDKSPKNNGNKDKGKKGSNGQGSEDKVVKGPSKKEDKSNKDKDKDSKKKRKKRKPDKEENKKESLFQEDDIGPCSKLKEDVPKDGNGNGNSKKMKLKQEDVISSSLSMDIGEGDEEETRDTQGTDEEDKREGFKDVQMVECGCFPADEIHAEPGPFYTHLGAAHDLIQLRKMIEDRTGFRGNQVRLEKVIYTGKEGKSGVGCPISKWILRRGSYEEQLLFLVKHRKGHKCSSAWIVVCVVIWEGVPPHFSDNLYDTMVYKLNRFGIPTTRRSDTNEQRSCACQGVDPDTCGAAYSFGCAWSMFFNGCKYARSRNVRKFRLTEEHEESELEEKVQHLATHLSPLYERVAPDSYTNQIDHENEGLECRLGYRPGRPFSGVTACVDYCSHAHKDAHNMMNGCTVTVSLNRHRNLSKPEDEQYHVLPLYKLDDTDEHGSKEGQKTKVKKGQLEILKKFPCKVRIRKVPLLPSRRRAKGKSPSASTSKSEPPPPPPVVPVPVGSKGPQIHVGDYADMPPLKREKLFDDRLPVPVANGTIGDPQYPPSQERYHSSYAQPGTQSGTLGHAFNDVGPPPTTTPGSSGLWNQFGTQSPNPRGSIPQPSPYFDHSSSGQFAGASSSLTSLTELTNSAISRHGSSSNLTSLGSSSGSTSSSTVLNSPGSGSASSGYGSSMSPILPSFRNTFMTENETSSSMSTDSSSAPPPSTSVSPRSHLSKSGSSSSAFQEHSSSSSTYPPSSSSSTGYHQSGSPYPPGGLYHPQPHNPCLPPPPPVPVPHHYPGSAYHESHSPYGMGMANSNFGMGPIPPLSGWGSGPGSYPTNYGYGSYPPSNYMNMNPIQLNAMGQYSAYQSRQGPPSWGPPPPFTPPMNLNLHPHPQSHPQPPQGLTQPPPSCFVTPPKPKIIPEVTETHSDNEDCFKDSQMGGVAIALTHGSVILQCAKHEMHATTALKNPNRIYPSRICLIFYQHKSMNNRFHGWSEWEKKIEAKKLQEVKLINQGKMEASPRKMKQLIKEGYIQDG